MLKKEDIEARIQELQAAAVQQQQLVQQVSNQICMIHGAIEEHRLTLAKMDEMAKKEAEEKAKAEAEAKAKSDAESNGACQDDCVNDGVKDGELQSDASNSEG